MNGVPRTPEEIVRLIHHTLAQADDDPTFMNTLMATSPAYDKKNNGKLAESDHHNGKLEGTPQLAVLMVLPASCKEIL